MLYSTLSFLKFKYRLKIRFAWRIDLCSCGDDKQILPPPISKSDFDKVLAKQRPTVSKDDLIIQDKFTKEFGEEG